jgi:hypothetical protein
MNSDIGESVSKPRKPCRIREVDGSSANKGSVAIDMPMLIDGGVSAAHDWWESRCGLLKFFRLPSPKVIRSPGVTDSHREKVGSRRTSGGVGTSAVGFVAGTNELTRALVGATVGRPMALSVITSGAGVQ